MEFLSVLVMMFMVMNIVLFGKWTVFVIELGMFGGM